MPARLSIAGATFRDPQNREVTLHGINVAGDSKQPAYPDLPSHEPKNFFEGDSVSFVDRPFSVADAPTHFARLRRWGYNCIRYIYTWEAVEHAGPGKYDEEFAEFTIKVLRIAKEYGFYVFMDPHQDVWSRFTGGSGAPMWTVYACGFDPQKLAVTQAALVQNTWPNPAEFPKMVWATNYTRLAAQTIFTLFFAGSDFAPKCIIDGKNIQDWLQDHFVGACQYLAQKIHDAGDLEHEVVIGHESINEPNKGYIGHEDLSKVPDGQNLRKYTHPSAWQAILTGSGRALEVDTYDFGNFGPYKSGSQLVDPKGQSAWLDPSTWDDTTYGWKRDDGWKLGQCIWAQHGVWDPSTDSLRKPKYFSAHPKNGQELDEQYFINNHFLDYYRRYSKAIRSVWPESMMLMQPCPFEIPPRIKGTDLDDSNLIFASHFYDGITLITKKWNKRWNVDVLGLLRGRYPAPPFALKIGETAIRNCFKDQLSEVRREGIEYMGTHPCMFTEIGIPYDMDDKKAYKTGDYSSQLAAIDANSYALEESAAQGFTWWLYTATNSHFWGDNWNGEDLSIYSVEDRPLPPTDQAAATRTSLDPANPSYSKSVSERETSGPVGPNNLDKTLSVDSMSATKPTTTTASSNSSANSNTPLASSSDAPPGFRAAEAYIRPTPIATHGKLKHYGFDLKSCTFSLTLSSTTPTPSDHPTEAFLPAFHFPRGRTSVDASGGKWQIETATDAEGAERQVLRWWHGAGAQKMTVKGVVRKGGAVAKDGQEDEEEGWLDAYWGLSKNCAVM